ncbi:hypothetical protein REMIM1_PE00207 (plasmid) [Rhizobium etli bv. mimosae str. Mim1]|nr:hypothetical protein REMIM1_PE00207 [Rhizobium etli bv. mimosae str. Mim1]
MILCRAPDSLRRCFMSVRDDVVADNDGHWSKQEIDAGAFRGCSPWPTLLGAFTTAWGAYGRLYSFRLPGLGEHKAAYRFFSNPNVEEGDILNGHFAATAQRYDACNGPILVLQDTTEFTYQRRNPHAVGFTKSVNSGRDKQERLRHHTVCGILMHSSLAVTLDGLPLSSRNGPGSKRGPCRSLSDAAGKRQLSPWRDGLP